MNGEEPQAARVAERRLAPVPAAPSLQLEIANAVVRAHKELFGRGPTKARVIVHGEIVVCVMADCLTVAERTLVRNGRGDAVALLRHEIDGVARPKLMRVIETITQRRVLSCTTGIDLDAAEHVASFRLDGPASHEPAVTAR